MRWDELFGDLEAQLDAAESAELAGEVAERTRREVAALSLVDRASPAVGHPVRLHLVGTGPVAGMLLEVGAQWLLLRDSAGREVLAPWTAVLGVVGLGVASGDAAERGHVFRRTGLSAALRAVARDRAAVAVHLVDGSVVTGTIDRVGHDFVEVGEHALGEQRRAASVSAMRAVPYSAMASVTHLL